MGIITEIWNCLQSTLAGLGPNYVILRDQMVQAEYYTTISTMVFIGLSLLALFVTFVSLVMYSSRFEDEGDRVGFRVIVFVVSVFFGFLLCGFMNDQVCNLIRCECSPNEIVIEKVIRGIERFTDSD